MLEEEERRRPQAREEQRLLEEPCCEPAHHEGEGASNESEEGVSFRAEAIYELLMDAVEPLGHQEATISVCGAATFILVLIHFIWLYVSISQELTTSKSSRSRSP